ncbi:hypothetical protein [Methanosarcina lacustris]|uniref:hypothetical protein n=1 Tax=Methanosarcina lacustris TaxID=170861 RepID=UPI000A7810D7|nr:hypothetical protein [Methanosarcina lacustris]
MIITKPYSSSSVVLVTLDAGERPCKEREKSQKVNENWEPVRDKTVKTTKQVKTTEKPARVQTKQNSIMPEKYSFPRLFLLISTAFSSLFFLLSSSFWEGPPVKLVEESYKDWVEKRFLS